MSPPEIDPERGLQAAEDQKRDETLREFVEARARHAEVEDKGIEEIHRLTGEMTDSRNSSTQFKTHVWRLTRADKQIIFAEVYWAGLSEVRAGALGTLKGLLQLIFGLHHLARHAAWAGVEATDGAETTSESRGLRGRIAHALQCVTHPVKAMSCPADAMAATLRGPIATLGLVSTVCLGVPAVLPFLGGETAATPVLASALALGLVIGWSGWRAAKTAIWRTAKVGSVRRSVAAWLGFLGATLLFLCLVPGLLRNGALADMPFEPWNETIQSRIEPSAQVASDDGLWYSLALADPLAVSIALVPSLLLLMVVGWAVAAIKAKP